MLFKYLKKDFNWLFFTDLQCINPLVHYIPMVTPLIPWAPLLPRPQLISKVLLLFYPPYYFLNFGFTKFELFFFIEFQVLIIPIITDLPLLEHLLQSCLLDLNHATYRAPCQIWPSPKNGVRPVISGMRLQVLKFQTVVKWLIVGYNKLVRWIVCDHPSDHNPI